MVREKALIVNCLECGKPFKIPFTHHKRGGGKYCSRACLKKHKGHIITTCIICGKEFHTIKSRINQGYGKFCSQSCYGKYKSLTSSGELSPLWKKRIKKQCIVCGSDIFVTEKELKYNNGTFCSLVCKSIYQKESVCGEKNPNWRGGTSYLPYCYKFNNRRKKATRVFFKYICLGCGKHVTENIVGNKQFDLSVHHIDHDKEQGCNGKPFNLVPLCHVCHAKDLHDRVGFKTYINKTLREGFKWGIWNEEEYKERVMYEE